MVDISFKSERDKRVEFDKKLYDTDIIQGIYDRLNELQDRIEELEKRCKKDGNKPTGQ